MTSLVASEPARAPLLLLDTHTLVWSVRDSPRLRSQAKQAINQAAREQRIVVSAITPWEIALLVSKDRLQLGVEVMQWIHVALAKPGVKLAPLEPEIAVTSTRLPFEMHPDPADRILVATARHLGATLVTADGALLRLAGKGCFRAMDAGS
ncbi:MAG: type II toxin-antitoxin system VapC family toxin [Terracidiphilus sp.]